MTKKGRTVLVAFAGSIGIIGIALILALSNGFQRYVDQIQEETLSSYPLTINQQSADITNLLLSMRSDEGGSGDNDSVTEQQYISEMFASLSTNDLKGLKKHLETHYDEIKDDVSTIKYTYSIDPLIYTKFNSKITKLNPSTALSSFYGSSSLLNSYSSFASIYSQMIDDQDALKESYDVLAGHWPENYDEMIIVLSGPNQISDLLIYSLGLRDPEELNKMITKIMSGETVDVVDPPLKLSYEDLMDVQLKLIMPSDFYRYNSEYGVYENLSENSEFMSNLYDNATTLKIVGIVSPKEDSASTALNSGVAYTSDLIKHIIDYSENTNIVKDQLKNEEIDVFSGTRFDEKKSAMDSLDFSDLISVDNEKLQSAFNININEDAIKLKTAGYMSEIAAAITTDTTPAANAFISTFDGLASGLKLVLPDTFEAEDVDNIVNDFLANAEPATKTTFTGLLKSVLTDYLTSEDYDASVEAVKSSPAFIGTTNMIAKMLTEATMKQTILTKVGELTAELSKSFASAFKVDPEKIASAFELSMTEEEITRIVTALMSDSEATATSNLISLGYQDLDSPTQISFYFSSFEGKENFLAFLDQFDDIKYSDTTGILMNSVKTIVNAVSYALIGFVSVSLIVSSIMIGIITYISVYERTKEIGILRAIGASKRNISSIFDAETFIIGLLSGLFGIGISYATIVVINLVLDGLIPDVSLRAVLFSNNAIILVVLSIILTLIGGFIPAKSASKKDPVEALRSE